MKESTDYYLMFTHDTLKWSPTEYKIVKGFNGLRYPVGDSVVKMYRFVLRVSPLTD